MEMQLNGEVDSFTEQGLLMISINLGCWRISTVFFSPPPCTLVVLLQGAASSEEEQDNLGTFEEIMS